MNLMGLFITSLLTENIILTKFLGICPFIGTSNKEKGALGMGISVTIVLTISTVLTYLIYNFILIPSETTYLKTIIFILVIASLVQMLEIILKKTSPHIHHSLGIYLPLIATNCAILGSTLLVVNNNYNFMETIVFSLGSGLGFTLVIYIFSTIREKLETSNIPAPFKGVPIALVVASIMALLFGRFIG